MTDSEQTFDEFKNRLRAARELRGLSQAQLAVKCGMPASSITFFERGTRKPSIANLRRLAVTLEVTADYLLGRLDDPILPESADPLFRDVARLPDKDRELAREFLRFLVERKE